MRALEGFQGFLEGPGGPRDGTPFAFMEGGVPGGPRGAGVPLRLGFVGWFGPIMTVSSEKGNGMGLRSSKSRGFTLIELLVVIVIICLIAALLLPAILKALCSARAGTASHLISQLDQAAEAYQLDYAVYPTGDGSGTKDLVYALQQAGPKKQSYFQFPQDLLTTDGNVVNPVWSDGDPTIAKIYYRLNAQQGGGKPGGGGGGGGGGAGGTAPPIQRKSKFDMWCAGCDYTQSDPKTSWSINNF